MLVACLLVCIRLIAGVICSTCILPLELLQSRMVHLQGSGDREACDHSQAQAGPVVQWACTVTQDETAFILPEISRLPLIVSLFVPLVFLLVSSRSLPLIAAHGRGPPPRASCFHHSTSLKIHELDAFCAHPSVG